MERFVGAVVAGGLALVAGLWLATLFAARSVAWFAGIGLVVAGLAGLAWGLASQVDVRRGSV